MLPLYGPLTGSKPCAKAEVKVGSFRPFRQHGICELGSCAVRRACVAAMSIACPVEGDALDPATWAVS
jgi:hypothetical protein